MGLDKSAYSRILDNIGSIVPCPFTGTDLPHQSELRLDCASRRSRTYVSPFRFVPSRLNSKDRLLPGGTEAYR
jgi:hypothetical protein